METAADLKEGDSLDHLLTPVLPEAVRTTDTKPKKKKKKPTATEGKAILKPKTKVTAAIPSAKLTREKIAHLAAKQQHAQLNAQAAPLTPGSASQQPLCEKCGRCVPVVIKVCREDL